jgi:pimeloyl-ACP methyl ester carboxylesterase
MKAKNDFKMRFVAILVSLSLGVTSAAQNKKAIVKEKATSYTAITVPTQYVKATGIKFAYRRLGKKAGVPLVFFQHFTGTLDNWDPLIVDGLAKEREVILFDNRGIASTEGEVPVTYAAMATDAIAFIEALGLHKVDLFGFSMGGGIAQEVALQKPSLVNKIILAGIAPRNGDGMQSMSPEAVAAFSKKTALPDEIWLDVLFSPSATSQAAGQRYLERLRSRKENKDVAINNTVAKNQMAAIVEWSKPLVAGEIRFDYLKAIKQPVLVVNGNNDIVVPTINSYHLQQHLPNATLILFPDSNHGSFDQYPTEFLLYANNFLNK